MRFEGTLEIRAPRDQVWQFLVDPEKVGQCAPGVESVEIVIPHQKFRAIVAIGFGSIKARFAGDAEFVELDPPHRATIKAHGSAPGSAADVTAHMALSDGSNGSTQMNWAADVVVLGTLASLAARLMGPITQKLTAEFFNCFKRTIEA